MAEPGHRFLEMLRRYLEPFVAEILPGLLCEQVMDHRRAAVRDRVAHDPIAIDAGRVSAHGDTRIGIGF